MKRALLLFFLTSILSPIWATEIRKVNQVCQEVHKKIPSMSARNCRQINFSAIPIATPKQPLPIIYKKIQDELLDKPNILVLGGIHSNELSSIEFSIKWLNALLKKQHPLYNWIVAPVININALVKKRPTRQNIHGVDINRNFPLAPNSLDTPLLLWEKSGKQARRYPGEKPFSEKETQIIDQLVRSFKPSIIITIHAPLDLVDYDGQPQNAPKKLGNLPLDLTDSFPGSLASYYWNTQRIPVLTIELASAKKLPSPIQTSHILYDLTLWLNKQYYPNLIPKDEISLFNQAMENLSLNKLPQATALFAQIEDKDLLLQAQNNLAYIHYLQNDIPQAIALWEDSINTQSPALNTVINNYLLTQTSSPSLSTIQLIPAPLHLLARSKTFETLNWRLNAWKEAWLNGDGELYFSLYVPKKSPRRTSTYSTWKKQKQKSLNNNALTTLSLSNIEHKMIIPNKQAESTFKQVYLYNNTQQVSYKKLIWERHQDSWKIRQEIIRKK